MNIESEAITRSARIYLIVVGMIYVALGIWCAAKPAETAQSVGFGLLNGSGRSEFFTVYGGMELGLGAFFLLGLRSRTRAVAAVELSIAMHAGIVLFRSIGFLRYEGIATTTYALAPVEWLLLIAAILVRRGTAADAKRPGTVASVILAVCACAGTAGAQDSRPASGPAALPERSDLSAWLIAEGIGPRPQGPRPTCSVFAATGTIEAAFARFNGRGERFSVEFENWAGNHATGRDDDGDFFHNILAGYLAFGAVPEGDWPYGRSFSPTAKADERLISNGKDRLEAAKAAIRLQWIKPNGPPGLNDEEFRLFRRSLADGMPVAIGASHSRLATGWIPDENSPGGARVPVFDSGTGRMENVSAEFIRHGVNDAFTFTVMPKTDRTDLRPLLGGHGFSPATGKDADAAARLRADHANAHRILQEIGIAAAGDQKAEPDLPARVRATLARGDVVLVEFEKHGLRLVLGERPMLDGDGRREWLVADGVNGYGTIADDRVVRIVDHS